MWYVECPNYFRLDVDVGWSVELLCNTSLTSDIMWSYDNNDDDGLVDYVYRNGRIDTNRPRLFIQPTANDFHILFIYVAQMIDSGSYDCYDGQGKRKVGYQLIIAGRRSIYCDAVNHYDEFCMS